MIDLVATEKRIEEIINVGTLSIPTRLRVYPGELDDLGKPINCLTVVVQFEKISYDDPEGNRFGNCRVPQINDVMFNIKIVNNDLRTYTKVYTIACELIERIRGQQILINKTGDDIQGTSPTRIIP